MYSLGATLWGGNNFSILTEFHKFPTNSIKYKSARRRRVNQALLPPPHEIRGERRWRCFWQTCAKAPFRATACQKKRHVLRPRVSWGVRTRAWLTPRRRALFYLGASLSVLSKLNWAKGTRTKLNSPKRDRVRLSAHWRLQDRIICSLPLARCSWVAKVRGVPVSLG